MSRAFWRFPAVIVVSLALILTGATLGLAEDVDRQTLGLKLNGSELVMTKFPFKRVSIANPDIADVVVLSPRNLYVYGKKVGYTNIILWEENKGKTLLDVVVSLDLTGLKERIFKLYPDQHIEVHGTETGIVLTGEVAGPSIVEQVIRLAQSYLPKEGSGESRVAGTGQSGFGITNLLRVGGHQQVMLEVKFAEVRRNSTKDWQAAMGLAGLGSDFFGALGTGTLGVGNTGGLDFNPGSLLLNFAGNAANIFVNIDNFTAALQLLESEGLARTMAEPHLVTQSGQQASFLAGGEFPVPVAQDNNTITIEYKEFGVGLVFTPVVQANGKITLKVNPSVSAVASTESIPSGIQGASFNVPNLVTRKLDATVELYDGQTVAMAGLLQDDLRESINKIPGLGDLPILGSLFRSNSYINEKTDLLVAVTPHLVNPVKEGTLTFPGEYLVPPNRWEFYFEGRLEGRRDIDQPSYFDPHPMMAPETNTANAYGLEGAFGHQPVTTR
ncbi:MAG: hypothetical protein C0616_03365 [Desulfuromonas sp.]|nr:MAG: hypothetical protein C0616_03365 [Desulfuromonas sp.]